MEEQTGLAVEIEPSDQRLSGDGPRHQRTAPLQCWR